MKYMDIFWYTFNRDFEKSEEEREEDQRKKRLAEKLKDSKIVVKGPLFSH